MDTHGETTRDTVEITGLVRVDKHGKDGIVWFLPRDGPNRFASLTTDPAEFGRHALAELHWAGILERRMVMTLRSVSGGTEPQVDGIGRWRLLGFRRETDITTAEQLHRHPRWRDKLPDLSGLMEMDVMDVHPWAQTEEKPTAHRVIQWRDDSVTLLQYHATPIGVLMEPEMLSPLGDLSQLAQRRTSPEDPGPDEQEQLASMETIHRLNLRITGPLPLHPMTNEESSAGPHLEAALKPSGRLARDFLSDLEDQRALAGD